ncbi:MAG: DUF1223 domain-containing protein [Alphaproteobacteria bacterium]|nr:DUF1223 domain-containing protein [Alphaproteobacteria bacterium]
MRGFSKITAILTLLLGLVLHAPAKAADNIAVYELFTSAGCGDAVAADEIFEKIAQLNHENLIALSCHLTFFDNRIQDPHSKHFCDYRYDQYSEHVMTEAGTPQVVINGRFDTSGTRENIVRDALALAHSLDTVRAVALALDEDSLHIALPHLRFAEDKPVDVWLLAYKKQEEEKDMATLLTGEGHHYINIVTEIKKLLEWDGEYRNLNVPLADFPADGYAVIAQYAEHSDILAAGKIEKAPKPLSSNPDRE